MLRRLTLGLTTALALSAHPLAAQEYAGEPFKCKRLMEKAEWVVEAVALNNWLNENASALTEDQLQPAREKLYTLVDADVQDWFQRHGNLAYHDTVPLVPLLLAHASRLGTIGSAEVARALARQPHFDVPASPPLPAGFRLTFDSVLFTLHAPAGWAAQFPYYFMIGALGETTDPEGGTFHVAMLSTAAARHEGLEGSSQSTILLVSSAGAEANRFRQKWLGQLQLSDSDRSAVPRIAGWTTYRGRDAQTGMRKELSFVHSGGGEMAVVYVGLPGTYECNEADFAAFAAKLRLGAVAP